MKKMARILASTFPYGFTFFLIFTGALNEMKQTRVVETSTKDRLAATLRRTLRDLNWESIEWKERDIGLYLQSFCIS